MEPTQTSWKEWAGTSLGAFAAALALLAAIAPVPGGAAAHAEALMPNSEAGGAAGVVQRFEPADPSGAEILPAVASIGDVVVNARLETRQGGARLIVVELENAGRRQAAVACRVGLARMTSPAVSPLARVVPPPQREELMAQVLRVSLDAGAHERREVPVPAGIVLASAAPEPQRAAPASPADLFADRPARSWAAVSIEALDGAH
jgi:hypothetical protein